VGIFAGKVQANERDKLKLAKGPFIIYGGGWYRREMFFVAKILLTQPLKKSQI
jgi:hypothetical protein